MRVTIRWKPLNPKQRWLSAAAGVVLILGLGLREFIIYSGPSVAQSAAFAVPDIPPPDLIVSEVAFISAADRRRIAGVLKNRSGRTFRDIQMTFSLVNADGDNVGSAAATIHQLEGHDAAKFEASGETSNAVEIVLKQIEAQPPAGAP